MVPLSDRQGLTAAELAARAAGREVVVWGGGDLAEEVVVSLRKAGLPPRALLHTDPAAAGCCGLPVLAAAAGLDRRRLVVVAAAAFRRQAEAACLQAGLRRDADFLSHLAIPRPHAVVDVAAAGATMSAATFAQVAAKLAADLPLLCRIELGLWGDPFANPELPAIVRIAAQLAPCTVTAALDALPADAAAVAAVVAAVMAASSARLDLVAAADAAPEEGARRLAPLFAALARHRTDHHTGGRVRLRLYRSRRQSPATLERWRALSAGRGIALALHTPYPPYDDLLAWCEGGAAPAGLDALPWEPERVLAACAADAGLPCLSQRLFPVIGPERGVALCHLYRGPLIAADYLSLSWEELLQRRHHADRHCRRCQRHGLHRLDLDVLARRHPEGILENPHGPA